MQTSTEVYLFDAYWYYAYFLDESLKGISDSLLIPAVLCRSPLECDENANSKLALTTVHANNMRSRFL